MKLISVHVPKTAGLSFQKHLTHLFGKRVVWDYNLTDRPDYKPEKPTPHILAQLRPKIAGLSFQKHLTNKTTVIHGHFFLSKYHHIPGLQRAMWFRDPVQRLLSHYYYWLRSPDMDHPNCRQLHEGGLSVVEFAEIPELRNVYTRFLDGEPLKELDWVGLVEDYQASLDLFYAMYAIGRDPRELKAHQNKNFARGDGAKYQLDKTSLAAIDKLNAKDMELYALAKLKFKDLVVRYGDGY
jgi:hypothetical protein